MIKNIKAILFEVNGLPKTSNRYFYLLTWGIKTTGYNLGVNHPPEVYKEYMALHSLLLTLMEAAISEQSDIQKMLSNISTGNVKESIQTLMLLNSDILSGDERKAYKQAHLSLLSVN